MNIAKFLLRVAKEMHQICNAFQTRLAAQPVNKALRSTYAQYMTAFNRNFGGSSGGGGGSGGNHNNNGGGGGDGSGCGCLIAIAVVVVLILIVLGG
mgnify:CR=1 FL=1